jgi:hypothetical protein
MASLSKDERRQERDNSGLFTAQLRHNKQEGAAYMYSLRPGV